MVNVGVISTLLVLASTATVWAGDAGGYENNASDRRNLHNMRWREDAGEKRDWRKDDDGVQRQLFQTIPSPPLITDAPTPPSSPPTGSRIQIRQAQPVLGPEGLSVSSSLSSSASSALVTVSSSFQSQLTALSSRSSAAVASASQAGSAAGSSAAAVSAAASASSAIASIGSSLAASASSAIASAQASATAAGPANVQGAASTATPTAADDLTQPSPAQNDGSLVVTPSQLVAVIIGTIIGTAIFTLILIYLVSICRNRRHDRAYLKFEAKKSPIALNSLTNVSSRGSRGEYLSREEKQRINWPSETHPALVPDPPPKDYPRTTRRAALPPLPEESPRTQHGRGGSSDRALSDGDQAMFAVSTLGFGPDSSRFSGVPSIDQPPPVKLQLTHRRSIGGSRRAHVVRVGSEEENPVSSSWNDRRTAPQQQQQQQQHPEQEESDSASSFLPLQKHSPIARTPSSEALPNIQTQIVSPGPLSNQNPSSDYPSPLTLNPTVGYTTLPPSWGSWEASPVSPQTGRGPRRKTKDQNHIAFLLAQSSQPAQPAPSPRPARNTTLSISPVSPYSESFASPTWPTYASPLSPPPKSPMRVLNQTDQGLRDAIDRDLAHYGAAARSSPTMPPHPIFEITNASDGSLPLTPTRQNAAYQLFPRVSAAYSAVGGQGPARLSPASSQRRSRSLSNIEVNHNEMGFAMG